MTGCTLHRFVPVVVAAVVGLDVSGMIPVAHANEEQENRGRAKVVPVNEVAFGNTYGEWSARWGQWALSIPAATSPATDTTGEFCDEGQSGPVWFLGAVIGITGPVVRTCAIPAGQALFFPVLSAIFGSGAFDCDPTVPGVVCNLAVLRVKAAAATDDVELSASVDGRALRDLHEQRVQSPAFTITYPEDGVFGLPAGSYSPNVSDGYWVMLEPLAPGSHTLHFESRFNSGDFAGTEFDVTYDLTVTP